LPAHWQPAVNSTSTFFSSQPTQLGVDNTFREVGGFGREEWVGLGWVMGSGGLDVDVDVDVVGGGGDGDGDGEGGRIG